MEVKLAHEVGPVGLDRLLADVQSPGNLPVPTAFGDQLEDLEEELELLKRQM